MLERTLRTATLNGRSDFAIFDQRPIELAGFRLKAQSAVPIGKPTLEEWTNALVFAEACENASPYWIGDLQLYAEGRADWREKLSQALAHSRLAKQTQVNLKSISKRVGAEARRLAPSRAHAAAVASLPAADQEKWLARSSKEDWTEPELRRAIKRSHRAVILEGQADEMHTVEVRVEVTVEAANVTLAEDSAWTLVKHALAGDTRARVIAAHARPK